MLERNAKIISEQKQYYTVGNTYFFLEIYTQEEMQDAAFSGFRHIVVMTEVDDPIVDVIQQLAEAICEHFKLNPDNTFFIEHYAESTEAHESQYNIVAYTLDSKRFTSLKNYAFASLSVRAPIPYAVLQDYTAETIFEKLNTFFKNLDEQTKETNEHIIEKALVELVNEGIDIHAFPLEQAVTLVEGYLVGKYHLHLAYQEIYGIVRAAFKSPEGQDTEPTQSTTAIDESRLPSVSEPTEDTEDTLKILARNKDIAQLLEELTKETAPRLHQETETSFYLYSAERGNKIRHIVERDGWEIIIQQIDTDARYQNRIALQHDELRPFLGSILQWHLRDLEEQRQRAARGDDGLGNLEDHPF